MTSFIQQLRTVVEEGLSSAAQHSENNIQMLRESIAVLRKSIDSLKEFATEYNFKDREEEIYFFRDSIPFIFSELIYFIHLYHFESRHILKRSELERKQVHHELKKIEFFLSDNVDFYHYYLSGTSFMNDALFTRGRPEIYLVEEGDGILIDTRFCTPGTFKLAKIMAFQKLQKYYNDMMKSEGMQHSNETQKSTRAVSWTDSKASLIEIVYALYASGSINQGKANVNEIAAIFEKAFNIQLGNYYRMFQNMRIRKKSRTNYIDLLKENLEKLMDDTDEFGHGR